MRKDLRADSVDSYSLKAQNWQFFKPYNLSIKGSKVNMFLSLSLIHHWFVEGNKNSDQKRLVSISITIIA